MTLFEIKAAAAAFLDRSVQDLTVNGVDLGLVALNQVRTAAELQHDFGFTRKLLTLNVDGVVGGSLDDVVEYGTDDSFEVKTIVDVGTFDPTGNLIPTEWTTVAQSLSQQRQENSYTGVRYPTDGQATSGPSGVHRFIFSGNKVFFFPKVINTVFAVGFEAYTFGVDWVDDDLLEGAGNVNVPWTTKGHQYLLWGSVVQLNNLFKEFVFRQEGNLSPPEKLADTALQTFINWDIFKYEQFRRHGR